MKDKVALVTGGSKGMGEAAVRIFAEKGASVAILDVDIEAAEKLSTELNENGANTIAIQCDVSSEAQVEKAIAKVVETYGKLDAAFNNAGIQIPAQDITETSEEDYDKILNVNLKGVWLCMKHELIQMKKQQSGARTPPPQTGHSEARAEQYELRPRRYWRRQPTVPRHSPSTDQVQ